MMGKILAGIGIVVILVIAAGAWWLFSVPSVTAAILYVDEGSVNVDLGQGWIQGTDEMELKEGAKISTGSGSASVVLQEGEVVHLEPNTEVELSEISNNKIHLKQAAGETWNKITKISGITTYEVETPNTVATVRGTEFYVTTEAEDDIAVDEGNVDIGFVKTPSKKLGLRAKHKVHARPAEEELKEEIFDIDPRAAKFREQYIKHLKRVRMREIQKYGTLINAAKKKYGMSDEQVQQYLEAVDAGQMSEDELYEKVPGPLKKKATRVYKLTKAIKKAQGTAR